MWKAMKKGFGFILGAELAHALLNTIADNVLRHWANDDEYMEKAKNEGRRSYDILKKYRKESVEEEEAQ
jgi:hypothetical protein